ncbi:MAG: hypothetical protein ABI563_14855 [Specibacter sp.]
MLGALLLVGCTPAPKDITEFTPPAATVVASVDCGRSVRKVPSGPGFSDSPGTSSPTAAGLLAGSVPAGFVPVQLMECFPAQPTLDADGKVVGWTVKQLRFKGDFAQVLAALAVPTESQEGVACLAVGETLPSLWLVNAEGRSANVLWPLDVCGMSKPEVTQALNGLTLSETKVLTVKGPSQ